MNLTWKVEGGADLARELDALRYRVSRKLQYQALFAGAEPIRRTAQAKAPFDPTSRVHLREHQIVKRAKDPDGHGAAAVAIGPARRTYWGAWQEWGTAHHAAQPYLRPAFDAMAKIAISTIALTLRAAFLQRGTFGSTRTSGGGIGDVFDGSRPPIAGGPGGGGLL